MNAKDDRTFVAYLKQKENLQLLVNATPYLDFEESDKSARYYCWKNNITERPRCPHCGNYAKFYSMKLGFCTTCCSKDCLSIENARTHTKYEKEIIETIEQLWKKCNESAKTIMISFRKEENYALLLKETETLPNSITKSERFYCWLNKLTEIPKCPYCGKDRRFEGFFEGYFATCGNKECKSEGIRNGNRSEKRDYSKQVTKMWQTYKEKTGYEHNMQNPEFKKKYFEDYQSKHNGEKCGVCSQKAIENRKRTFDEKYDGNVYNALKEGLINKYGSFPNHFKDIQDELVQKKKEEAQNELVSRLNIMGYEFIKFVSKNIILIKCKRCNREFEMSRMFIHEHYRNNDYKFCNYCDYKNMTFRSNFEENILETIKEFYNGNIETNIKHRFNGVECDIVIPELKLGIEANGIYWHTEQYKEKNSHINKKKILYDNGFFLIQIWEDEWKNPIKHEIIVSRLKEIFSLNYKILPTECIYSDNVQYVKEFLENNHLQGYISSTYKCGLYHNDELVMLMTVEKTSTDVLELSRICTKNGYSIIGGFAKLISHFRELHAGEKMISYADCDWYNFDENEYTAAGFRFVKLTSPNYSWCKREVRNTKPILIESHNKNKSEVQIMHELGYYRLYDSGSLLYEIIL